MPTLARIEAPRVVDEQLTEWQQSLVMPRSYWIYILASLSRRLYTGMTSDLPRRVWQHRHGILSRHAPRYRICKLVYYEQVEGKRRALAREKQIKGWPRERRLRLIEEQNAGWLDLAVDWFRVDDEQVPLPAQRDLGSGDGE